jgi:hypothetical protein
VTRTRFNAFHCAGNGMTALVTTSEYTPIASRTGRMALSSLCRMSGSPPTNDTCIGLRVRIPSSTPSTSASPVKSRRPRSVTPPPRWSSP